VFARAGLAVLVLDNHGWGESGTAPGEPRHEVDPWEQIRDCQHAITAAQNRIEVDPDRIGVWGTSFSAGHAFVVAAIDRRVKAVCGQARGRQRSLGAGWPANRLTICPISLPLPCS
jgi:dienelactone hydrolase